MSGLAYQCVVLKISGEALMGKASYGIDFKAVEAVARQVKDAHALGVRIGVVLGGGNIIRGASVASAGIDRTAADYMGMLATIMNGIALQNALEKIGVQTRLQTAIEASKIAEPYLRRRAIRHLDKKRVVIFVGGTGNPYFSTDTAAALRANEIEAQVILKGTKVDGVYTADPYVDQKAEKFDQLTFIDVLNKRLKVMDATAISLCMENNIPIIVFDMWKKENLKKILQGEKIGTIVSS